jgi:hypothetical protein
MNMRKIFLLFLSVLMIPIIGFSNSKHKAADDIAEQISRPLKPKNGVIALVKGDQVYINIGLKEGVQSRDTFRIVRFGEEIILGGESLGKEETEIGIVEITAPKEKFSIGKLKESKSEPKKNDGVFSGDKKTRIALMRIDTTEKVGNNFLELLQNALSQRHWIKTVEMTQRADIAKELEFNRSGLVDANVTKKFGRMLSADGLLNVKISKLESDIFMVDAKLINTETGVIMSSAKTKFTQVKNCCCEKVSLINELYAKRKIRWTETSKKYKWISAKRCNTVSNKAAEKFIFSCVEDSFCGK